MPAFKSNKEKMGQKKLRNQIHKYVALKIHLSGDTYYTLYFEFIQVHDGNF